MREYYSKLRGRGFGNTGWAACKAAPKLEDSSFIRSCATSSTQKSRGYCHMTYIRMRKICICACAGTHVTRCVQYFAHAQYEWLVGHMF